MFWDIPATKEPTTKRVSPMRKRGFLPYRSDSFPAIGMKMVSNSIYAVASQEYSSRPSSDLAISGPQVPTMVPSKHAMSMARQSPTMIMLRTLGSMFL